MSRQAPPDTPVRKPAGCGNVLLVIICSLLFVLGIVTLGSCLDGGGSSSSPVRTIATPFPTREINSLQDLEELDDIYGGWRADDGRELLFNSDSTFMSFSGDGSNFDGQWYIADGDLCLVFSTGEQCHPYNQYSNVLKFGEAIYYRY